MGWKLVRDNNQKWCLAHGVSGQWRTSPHPIRALTRKLFEEAAEFSEYHDPGELYDLYDVLIELIRITDPNGTCLKEHEKKREEMGHFGTYTEWCPVPAKPET